MAKKKKKSYSEILREAGRIISASYYDYQSTRIGMLNRVRDVVRRKNEGIAFDAVEEKKLSRADGKLYNDTNLFPTLDGLKKDKKITEKERDYLKRTLELAFETKKTENAYAKLMDEYIETEPIWVEFLDKVKGVGKILSTNLIKEYGYCERYAHVTSLWKHSGQHVLEDGTAPRLRKGMKPDYSPKLKTFVWKIGDCLMKLNFEGKGDEKKPLFYRRIYDKEKARQLARKHKKGELAKKYNGYKDEDTQLSKGHAHNRALRKMRKIFLEHYWVASRELAGLDVGKPYQFEYPGEDGKVHDSYLSWEEAIKVK